MVDSTDVTAGTNATATQYNNLRKDVVLAKAIQGTETYVSPTTTIDWSDLTKGKIRTITITGDITLAFSNVTVGQVLFIRVIQGAGGSHLLTWPTIKWPGGAAPTLTTTAGAIDAFMIVCTATDTYDGYHAGFGLS